MFAPGRWFAVEHFGAGWCLIRGLLLANFCRGHELYSGAEICWFPKLQFEQLPRRGERKEQSIYDLVDARFSSCAALRDTRNGPLRATGGSAENWKCDAKRALHGVPC